MPLGGDPSRGPEINRLRLAVDALAALPPVIHSWSGSIEVGNLSPDTPLKAAALVEVDFALITPPTGSAARRTATRSRTS